MALLLCLLLTAVALSRYTTASAGMSSSTDLSAFAAFLRWQRLPHAVVVLGSAGRQPRQQMQALVGACHTQWVRADDKLDCSAFAAGSARVGVYAPAEQSFLGAATADGCFNARQAWFISIDADRLSTTLARWSEDHFGHSGISVDADVTLALRTANDTFSLYDLYRLSRASKPLLLELKGGWSPTVGLSIADHYQRSFVRRRHNLGNLTLRAATAILERPSHLDQLEYLADDTQSRELDLMQRKTYQLLQLLTPMWNLTYAVTFKDRWGAALGDGNWTGVVGAILNDDVELSVCPLRLTKERFAVLSFCPELHIEYIPFIFRHPRRNAIRNIFFEPLTTGVWWCVLSLVALSLLLLCLLSCWQASADGERRLDYLMLLVLEAFLQQGPSPQLYDASSARQLLLWVCLFAFLLLQFYGGFIVGSLLAQTPRSITTLQALYNSSLELGMEDIAYNYDIFANASSGFVRELYARRICREPRRDHITTIEQGARRIQSGGFAFHVSANRMLYLLKSMLSDDEFCDLQQINLAPPYQTSIAVARRSPYREHISVGILQLRTTGLMQRNNAKWQTAPTDCSLNPDREVVVDLEHFVPALAFLAAAHLLAVGALFLEWVTKCAARRTAEKTARR